jgi:hypothetical protein
MGSRNVLAGNKEYGFRSTMKADLLLKLTRK